MNIFEQAARLKLRFSSVRGDLTVENLFEKSMPLVSREGFDLDTIAKTINKDLKASTEESFVAEKSNPAKDLLELKLEIVKFVIAEKLKDKADRETAAARKAERDLLVNILDRKNNEALNELTPEQIKARIAELDS